MWMSLERDSNTKQNKRSKHCTITDETIISSYIRLDDIRWSEQMVDLERRGCLCGPLPNPIRLTLRQSWGWGFESHPGHKSANLAVHLPCKLNWSCRPLWAVKVKQRRKGDKRHRHEAGLLKSGDRKNLSHPCDLYRLLDYFYLW